LLEEFEADGALAGHDVGVVEGVDEGEVLLGGEAGRLFAGLVVVGAVEQYLCAKAACGGHFDEWRGERHDEEGADAAGGGVVGNALRVVAGGGGDDAAGGLLGREGGDAVERAALLEAAGHLQVFELEVDLLAGERGEELRVRARRVVDGAAQALAGRLDRCQIDGQDGCCKLGRHCFRW